MTTPFKNLRGLKLSVNLYRAINRQVGIGQHQYNMLEDGDRVAVAISGGKDSFSLMWILRERLLRSPISYELQCIHIDPGFNPEKTSEIQAFCEKMDWPLHVEHTTFGIKAHSSENLENPCFLCSKLRRKRLFELSKSMGCNKLALGHHKDDIIETLFLNMFYAGEIASMKPVQSFFGGEICVIRPLAFVDERKIERFSAQLGIPAINLGCPSEKNSKRSEIKEFLNDLYKTNNKIRGNIFRSMGRVKKEYLL